MGNKVSDFKLAQSTIYKMCKENGVKFVDVPLSFGKNIEGTLFVDNCKNIAHTTFNIIVEYINKSLEITGVQFLPDEKQKNDFLIMLSSNLRNIMYGEDTELGEEEEPNILRLYHYVLVWILLKDIICPSYNKELINTKVICAGDSKIDIARYFSKEDVPSEEISTEPFIFVNNINNRTVQNAFIFIEALKSLDLSPVEIVKDLYETDLYEKYHGLLEIALDEEDVLDFECAVFANLGVNFYAFISRKVASLSSRMVKIAQNSVPGLPNQFWYYGVLEKLMEPSRGADWETYKNLEPYIKQFWDKVEQVRKQRIKSGHDITGVPFDVLLRIKSHQTSNPNIDVNKTLQSLLSSDRVW